MLNKILISLSVICLFVNLSAQEPIVDIDKYYLNARELALNKEYIKARNMARNILSNAPDYYDAGVLIARTFAWENQFDSARIEINKVLVKAPHLRDAIFSSVDIEFWSGNAEKALEILEMELSVFPNDKDLIEKKIQILMAMGREQEAQEYLASLLQQNPYNYQVIQILSQSKKYKNRLAAEHTLDWYTEPNAYVWQCISLQYQREANWGTWIGKLNMGSLMVVGKNVTPKNNFQVEADAYPRLDSLSYLYTNLGLSPGDFFPNFRTGIEYFRTLPDNWEFSIGGRYLYFDNSLNKSTFIFTGSIGKYFGKNWFSYRPYLIVNKEDVSHSHYLFYRHYLNNAFNYLGGALGFGSSPDETYNRTGQLMRSANEIYRIRFDFQHKITKKCLIRIMLGNAIEEYSPEMYRYRFDSNFYLAWLF